MSESPPVQKVIHKRRPGIASLATTTIAFVMIGLVAVVGYQLAKSRIKADLYKERLEQLATEYEALRVDYNDAVRQNAVTELVVEDGKLTVVRRDALGNVHETPTTVDPTEEVYIDYIVYQDRLWIRSVFDATRAPRDADVIDPAVWGLDWSEDDLQQGRTIFRPLDEGRWVVTATENGSLTVRRREPGEDIVLVKPPAQREFDEMQQAVDQSISDIGIGDAFRQLVGQ